MSVKDGGKSLHARYYIHALLLLLSTSTAAISEKFAKTGESCRTQDISLALEAERLVLGTIFCAQRPKPGQLETLLQKQVETAKVVNQVGRPRQSVF